MRSERGASAVEFALIAPMFFMLVFGIIDFAYMMNRDTMVNNSARDGVRIASLDGTYAQIVAGVKAELAGYGIPTTAPTTTITVDCIKADDTPCNVNGNAATYDTLAQSGATAVVSVSYNYSWITPMVPSMFGSPTLSQQTRMRIE